MPEITKLQWRRGTAAQWVTADPVLSSGTPGFETDTGKFKIGDGVTAWTALPYSGVAADTHTATAKETLADSDEFPLADSAASYGIKKTLFSTIKSAVASYIVSAALTFTNKTITSPKVNQILDTDGDVAVAFPANASAAANYLSIYNGAAGEVVQLYAAGSDTNVHLALRPRGTSGEVRIMDSGANALVRFARSGTPVNYFWIQSSNTGSPVLIEAAGTDTNIGLNLKSKGTGTVQANGVPLVTTTGAQAVTNKTLDATNTSTQWIKRSIQNVSAPAVLGATAATDYVTFSKMTEPVALLNCEGANNSTTFTDSGYLAADWTASGDAKISTAQSKWGNGSAYFDGTGDYIISTAPTENFAFGLRDWCFEAWLRPTNVGNTMRLFTTQSTTAGPNRPDLYMHTDNTVRYRANNSGDLIVSSTALSVDTWHHVAISRSGTSTRLFINGTQEGSTYTDTVNYAADATRAVIGANAVSYLQTFQGYMQDIRIFNGVGLYTGTFTPPSRLGRSYEDVATADKTVALLHGNGANASTTFTDSGVLQSNWSQVGSAQISTAQSKYGGSSIYLSANNQGVRAPNADMLAFGSSDFTVEMWLYSTSFPGSGGAITFLDARPAGGTNGAYIDWYFTNAGAPRLWVNTADRITSGSNLSTDTWYHLALCRSGTTHRMFVDGTQVGIWYGDSTVYLPTDATFAVLGNNKGTNGGFIGHINDFRVTKGLARYTTTFTPPASLLPDVPVLRLPTAAGNTNRYTMKQYGPQSILAGGVSGQTIDGASSVVVASGDSNDFVSDGSNWRIV